MAHDLQGACDYYRALLGWDFGPGPARLGPYVRASVGGRLVAGIGEIAEEAGYPVDWITYFAVDSADQVAQRIRDCGGTVALGPLDSGDAGRLALAADPWGATFGIWEAHAHAGWQLRRAHGSVVWSELLAPSVLDAADFYAKSFGMDSVADGAAEVERDEDAILLKLDGHRVAGIREAGPEEPHPRWRVYFAVDDVDLAVKSAESLGGRLVATPRARRYGEVAYLQDPQGGPFALVRLADAAAWPNKPV
ncbi:putative enzyme related to lactoylglutathione lyase [Streptacidiphilus sp. BW17]|uniref:VOC family protein n=1 Tax=Streptacidiphilus sp. BW17 TaxID=3156274 RepID=UPI003516BFD8